MSKSLKRVTAALVASGVEASPLEIGQATTAIMASELVGCTVDQIAKSIIFRGQTSNTALLFVTAGGNQVDAAKASALAGEPLGKADAALIREQTGFAIGGVAPIGHLTAPRTWIDPLLLEFDLVWAAAGTPRHVFAIDPRVLVKISGGQVSDFTS